MIVKYLLQKPLNTFTRILGVVILLSLILTLSPATPSQAVYDGPTGNIATQNQTNGLLSTDNLCANMNWIDVNKSVKIKGTYSGSAVEELTPRAKLTFDDNSVAYVFCTDISHSVGDSQRYCLDTGFFSDWRITWLVNHYPPSTNRIEQAARQAAVWHFTDGFDLNQVDPTTEDSGTDNGVKIAYNAILAAIPASQPPEYDAGNIQLTIDPATATNFLPGQSTHPFTVRLTKGSNPLVGYTVNVSTDFGSLDKNSSSTDSNGEATFTVTSSNPGTAHLSASAQVSVPAGSRFIHATDPLGKQRMVLGETKTITVQANAQKTWSNAENIIIAHKFEDRNYNQVQDAGEPNLKDWQFTLTLPDNTTFQATTDTNGNAYFYNTINSNGTYTLTESLKSYWTNSTSLSQSRVRSDQDAWTQWNANFGNAQYSLITVYKFEDLNGNGQWEPNPPNNEPAFPGWQFALYKLNGSTWQQFSGGTTGTDGSISFTDLDAGQYKVVEQPKPDYQVTTGSLEQSINLNYPEHRTLHFGNQRKPMDYGDLPDNYHMTTFADNGARHDISETSIRLGEKADVELDGQPNDNSAKGDDNNGVNDEDGVVHGGSSWGNGNGQVIVTVTDPTNSGKSGCLMGWLDYYDATNNDFGADGIFSDSFLFMGGTYSEKIIDNLYVPAGSNTIDFTLPSGLKNVGLFARFRLSPYDPNQGVTGNRCKQPAAGLTGLVIGGEVEDYAWVFGPTAIQLQSFHAKPVQASGIAGPIVAILAILSLVILWTIQRKTEQ